MRSPYVIGLTGSIGMGKSTTTAIFADLGCAVWDADRAVHRLYSVGGAAVGPVSDLCPDAVANGSISRERLKDWIARDPKALGQIEAVVHPLVAKDRQEFLNATAKDIAVLDIPLLFEGGAPGGLDCIVVVSAPADLQRERVLARPGMTEERFELLLANQMPDAEKRRRADHVIETVSLEATRAAVKALVEEIRENHA